jgi:hypothetical protein
MSLRATTRVQLTGAVVSEKGRTEGLEREYMVRKTTLEMLPEAPRHLAELQDLCAARYSASTAALRPLCSAQPVLCCSVL